MMKKQTSSKIFSLNHDLDFQSNQTIKKLAVKPSPKRLFFYGGCKPIETLNGVKVSITEKHRCEKCYKPFCLYIASRRSLVGKIKDEKIADKHLE